MTAKAINYKEACEKLEKEFEQYKKESVKYTIDDIIDADENYVIGIPEAQIALETMIDEVDKQQGINRDTFAQYLQEFGNILEQDDYEDYEEDEDEQEQEDYQDDDQIIM